MSLKTFKKIFTTSKYNIRSITLYTSFIKNILVAFFSVNDLKVIDKSSYFYIFLQEPDINRVNNKKR